MNGDIDLFHHLLTVITVIATVTLSLTVTHRRTETRQRRDAEGLRAVLLAELDILLGAYETCLRRLDAREETLLSCRQLIAGYRANLARLPALGAAEAGAVTRAYGFAEAIESFLAGVCKPYGQHAWRVLEGEAPLDEIRAMYREGGNRILTAQALLGGRLDGLPDGASARPKVPAAAPVDPNAAARERGSAI